MVPEALPGSPMLDDQSSVNPDEANFALAAMSDEYGDNESMSGGDEDGDNGTSEAAAASDARAHWSRNPSMMPNQSNHQSFNHGRGSESDDSKVGLNNSEGVVHVVHYILWEYL